MTYCYSFADTTGTTGNPDPSGHTTWAYSHDTYDDDGELTGTSYSSNFANAPTSNTSQSYDPNGNRTNDGAAGAGDRLLTDGVYDYSYDADGNRIARTQISNGAVTTYTWNNANQLTAVKYQATCGGTVQTLATYAYDAFGLMVSQTESGATEYFIYDGQNVALVLNSTGQVLERELNGPAVDQVLASETNVPPPYNGAQGPGTVNWLLADNQGTVRDVAVYNGSTIVADHLVYDSFGQLTSQTNSSYQPRFTYDGMRYDSVSGLYYDIERWYDPVNGLFISQDPLGFGGGQTNLSEYCGNSATNYFDPSGEWSLFRWVYTGDGNASDEVYNAATKAAGEYYLQNAGDTHQALASLGGEGKAVSYVLQVVEGDNLHQQVMQRQVGPANIVVGAVPLRGFGQPGNAARPKPRILASSLRAG